MELVLAFGGGFTWFLEVDIENEAALGWFLKVTFSDKAAYAICGSGVGKAVARNSGLEAVAQLVFQFALLHRLLFSLLIDALPDDIRKVVECLRSTFVTRVTPHLPRHIRRFARAPLHTLSSKIVLPKILTTLPAKMIGIGPVAWHHC